MEPGRRLGHFEIQRKLGQGGMGEVYLARDTRLDRPVAIKILPADTAADAGRRARFAREARAASALNHPGIAHIYDVGEEDGIHFIAMEYVEGADLARRIAAGPLGLDEALSVAIQAASALEAARGKGIIHRDIKPANIALTDRGEVKVLDFGLAKMTPAAGPDSVDLTMSMGRTADGAVLGTVRYMSPEQGKGREVDTRSDLFSLGLVIHEMITGEPAFAGEGFGDTLAAIMTEQPPGLAAPGREVPAELERIVRKCLEKDPDHRYQTPRDLLVDLKNLQRGGAGATSAAPPPAKPARPSFMARRARILVPVLVLAALAAWFLKPGAEAGIDSLVVVPFVNTTGDPEIEYLCDGVTETLINALADVPDLRVISRISAYTLKGREIDPADVGALMDVDALLLGRVVRHGDELDITTELVMAADSRQVWGRRYTRPVGQVQSISQDITGTIAKTLELELGGEVADKAEQREAADPEAYRLYLQGQYFTTGTMREMDGAIEFYEKALAIAPDYALAWAGLAQAHARQMFLRGTARDANVVQATEAARMALKFGPELPESLAASGLIKMYFDQDWEGAGEDLRRAYELASGNTLAVITYGDFLLFSGRYEEAVAVYHEASRLDPLSHVAAHDLGFAYMALHDYEKAEAQFRRAIDLNPNWVWGHIKIAKTYAHLGRCAEALAATAVAEDLLAGSGTPSARSWLDYTYALCGNEEKAREGLAELMSREEYVDPTIFAIVQLGLGDIDGAIANLERAIADRSTNIVFLRMTPDVYPGPLGDDPRFRDMVRRTGFPGS
jgi:TolB-like protein/tetratricopeptide (TPR) repeat protein/predicted Ser/Thr protein kinase